MWKWSNINYDFCDYTFKTTDMHEQNNRILYCILLYWIFENIYIE